MSGTEINQVLAQMRIMAAAASGDTANIGNPANANKVDFAALMKDSLNQVNEAQSEAKALATAFEAGEESASLPEVMVALQKANISFQAMSQVRNKLLMAYQEVMKMQV